MAEGKPNPGSDAAQAAGCRCPVMDNNRGRGRWDAERGEYLFWFNGECPLHGLPKDEP